MSFKAIALQLAALGYHVFPLTANSKKPWAGSNGLNDATRDPAIIHEWWDRAPESNVGIAPDDGMTVIDLDTKDPEKNGLESLRSAGMVDQDAVVVTTPTDGQHWYYLAPEPWTNRVGVMPGVDIRAKGGYLVAPGSVIDGRAYEGTLPPRGQLPSITDSLSQLRTFKRDVEKTDEPLGDMDTERQCERFVDWLRHHAPPCEEGTRNDTVAKTLAPMARDFGVSADRALPLIGEHWPDCTLDPVELETAVHSGWRSAQNAPGSRDALARFESAGFVDPNFAPVAEAPVTPLLVPYFPGISERPAPRPQLHAYLPRQELWLHSAPPKTMKTHFLLWTAARCGHGMDWAGGDFLKAGAAVYALGEGTDSIPARTDHIMQTFGVEQLPNLAVFDRVPHVKRDSLEMLNEWERALGEIEKEHDGIALIVLDTARRVLAGGNISAEEDASLLIEYGERLARTFDCLTVLVHHPGKAKGNDHRGSAILETDPGIVTTHEVGTDSEGQDTLWLNFKYHRYMDAADIPALGFRVEKGAGGPIFEFRDGAHKPKTGDEMVDDARVQTVLEILRENPHKTLKAQELGDMLKERLGPEGPSREAIGRWMTNAQGGNRYPALREHRFKSEIDGRWYWLLADKTPAEVTNDDLLVGL